MNDKRDVQSPQELHPAFYGCYDWHSSVHGHWMLVRLLRMFPNLPEAKDIHKALAANLTRENILVETAYLKRPNRQSFERTYGWAWLLKLAEELHLSQDAETRKLGGQFAAANRRFRRALPVVSAKANLCDSYGRPSKHGIWTRVRIRLRKDSR